MLALAGIPTQAQFPTTDSGGCQLRTGLPQTPQGSHLDITVGNYSANIRLLTVTDPQLGVRGGIQWTDTFTMVAGPGQIRDSSWDNCVGFAAEDYVTNQHAIIYATLYEKGDPVPIGSNAYGGFLSPSGSTAATLITGSIVAWPQTTPPPGAVICDGSVYNSVADPTFAPLFSVIGTSFGGSGASAFNVPDIRGRVICGLNALSSVPTLGQNDALPIANRTISHNHTVRDPGHTHNYSDPAHNHPEQGWQRTIEGAGTIAPFTGIVIDAGGTGSYVVAPISTTAASLIGITIQNGLTGIGVGPGGTLGTDFPAFIVMPHIIYK